MDRHLRGLIIVAKQQPCPLKIFIFILSHSYLSPIFTFDHLNELNCTQRTYMSSFLAKVKTLKPRFIISVPGMRFYYMVLWSRKNVLDLFYLVRFRSILHGSSSMYFLSSKMRLMMGFNTSWRYSMPTAWQQNKTINCGTSFITPVQGLG